MAAKEPAAEANAVMGLKRASRWLHEHSPDPSPLDLAQLRAGTDDDANLKATAYVRTLDPYFALLTDAAAKPAWFAYGGHTDEANSVAHHGWLLEADRVIEGRVLFDQTPTDLTERAASCATLYVNLGRCVRPSSLVEHALAVHLKLGACRVFRMVADKAGFDARQFRALVDPVIVEALRVVSPPESVLVGERDYGIQWVRRLAAGEAPPSLVEKTLGVRRCWLGRPLLYSDGSRFVDVIDQALRGWPKTAEAAALSGQTFDLDGPRWLVGAHGIRSLFERHADAVAALRLLRIVMALLEVRQRDGAYPGRLEGVGSMMRGDMPLDPYGGTYFGYELVNERAVRLWSHRTGDMPKDVAEGLAWLLQ